MQIIFSCQANSMDVCLTELLELDRNIKFIRWIDKGIGIIEVNKDFPSFSELIRTSEPVFIRHMFPVYLKINIYDIEKQTEKILEIIDNELSEGCIFSLQLRDISKGGYKNFLNEYITDLCKNKGFELNISNPDTIISGLIDNESFYMGISSAEDNLSCWNGGMHRYQRYEGQISRAEFKLLEAVDEFKIICSEFCQVLDLGAAPGGWSKVMLDKGMYVTAVDPAEIDKTLSKNSNMVHFRETVQQFILHNINQYDIILNDMKMDISESCKIMLSLAPYLKENGLCIMTFKLQEKGKIKQINRGLRILGEKYNILHAKQLFHNRSEITVIFDKINGKN